MTHMIMAMIALLTKPETKAKTCFLLMMLMTTALLERVSQARRAEKEAGCGGWGLTCVTTTMTRSSRPGKAESGRKMLLFTVAAPRLLLLVLLLRLLLMLLLLFLLLLLLLLLSQLPPVCLSQ